MINIRKHRNIIIMFHGPQGSWTLTKDCTVVEKEPSLLTRCAFALICVKHFLHETKGGQLDVTDDMRSLSYASEFRLAAQYTSTIVSSNKRTSEKAQNMLEGLYIIWPGRCLQRKVSGLLCLTCYCRNLAPG